MNIRTAKTDELALIIRGLESIYVADSEATRQKLLTMFKGELSARGLKLAETA